MTHSPRELDRDNLGDLFIVIVGLGALIASFDTLAALAEMAGWHRVWTLTIPKAGSQWDIRMSWILPVVVDVYGIAAARVWLLRRWWVSQATRDHARVGTQWAIGGSIAGNALSHALTASGFDGKGGLGPTVAVLLAILIAAVPPATLAAVVHLKALLNRDRISAQEKIDRQAAAQESKADTGTGTPGSTPAGTRSGTARPAATGNGRPAPRPAGTTPVSPPDPASTGSTGTAGTAAPTGTGPAPKPDPAAEPAAAAAGEDVLLLDSLKELDQVEIRQIMAEMPGKVPTMEDLRRRRIGSGRALRIRKAINAIVNGATPARLPAGTGIAAAAEEPGPAEQDRLGIASTATPVTADDPGTDPSVGAGTDEDIEREAAEIVARLRGTGTDQAVPDDRTVLLTTTS